MEYLFSCAAELMALPFCAIINMLIMTYSIKKPVEIYRKVGLDIQKNYAYFLAHQKGTIDPISPYTVKQSHIIEFTSESWLTLKMDIPHIPAFILSKVTFLSLYNHQLEPSKTPNLIFTLVEEYYKQAVLASARG